MTTDIRFIDIPYVLSCIRPNNQWGRAETYEELVATWQDSSPAPTKQEIIEGWEKYSPYINPNWEGFFEALLDESSFYVQTMDAALSQSANPQALNLRIQRLESVATQIRSYPSLIQLRNLMNRWKALISKMPAFLSAEEVLAFNQAAITFGIPFVLDDESQLLKYIFENRLKINN